MEHLILASGSPRRQELLNKLHIPFSIVIPSIDETPLIGENELDYVRRMAKSKADVVKKQYPGHLVIGADTIVYNGKILGKPANKEQAYDMISQLQGKTHSVLTGVSMGVNQMETFVVKTLVTFVKMSDTEIMTYVKSREPYDKAGGYAIQGEASKYIKSINGCYYNVMGFPLSLINAQLKKLV
ncbi:MAG: septum formation protein Maf [Clostridiales bacterium]|nr:septum formation protein Maf [Clostridiales bacterium]